MGVRNLKNKGIIYIIIALLCLAILFLGFKILIKLTGNNSEDSSIIKIDDSIDNNEEEVVEAFITVDNYEDSENKGEGNQKEYKEYNSNNVFLKILLSSNNFFRLAFESEYGVIQSVGVIDTVFDILIESIKPNKYIESQFPAILSLIKTTPADSASFSFIKDSDKENEPTILEDIVFVEDPAEAEVGEILENNQEKTQNGEMFTGPDTVDIDSSNPYVLLYHTHGTEAYLPIKENTSHIDDRKYNVTGIGEIIATSLSNSGHKVKHIDIYHDIPSYSESYSRSLSTVKKTLEEEKSIKLIFDVHRDGVAEDATYYEDALAKSKIDIDGKKVATFFLVIGPENQNKDKLIKFAQYIERVSNKLYPGLCKGIVIKPYGKFNQYVSDYYALVEVGSNLNTVDEAKESAKLIGEILHEVINGIRRQ